MNPLTYGQLLWVEIILLIAGWLLRGGVNLPRPELKGKSMAYLLGAFSFQILWFFACGWLLMLGQHVVIS